MKYIIFVVCLLFCGNVYAQYKWAPFGIDKYFIRPEEEIKSLKETIKFLKAELEATKYELKRATGKIPVPPKVYYVPQPCNHSYEETEILREMEKHAKMQNVLLMDQNVQLMDQKKQLRDLQQEMEWNEINNRRRMEWNEFYNRRR